MKINRLTIYLSIGLIFLIGSIAIVMYGLTNNEAKTQPHIAVINNDSGATNGADSYNYGNDIFKMLVNSNNQYELTSQTDGEQGLKDKKYDLLIYVPSDFSKDVLSIYDKEPTKGTIYYKKRENLSVADSKMISYELPKIEGSIQNKITDMYLKSIVNSVKDGQNVANTVVNNNKDFLDKYNTKVNQKVKDFLSDSTDLSKSTNNFADSFGVFTTNFEPFKDGLSEQVGKNQNQLTSLTKLQTSNQKNIDTYQQNFNDIFNLQNQMTNNSDIVSINNLAAFKGVNFDPKSKELQISIDAKGYPSKIKTIGTEVQNTNINNINNLNSLTKNDSSIEDSYEKLITDELRLLPNINQSDPGFNSLPINEQNWIVFADKFNIIKSGNGSGVDQVVDNNTVSTLVNLGNLYYGVDVASLISISNINVISDYRLSPNYYPGSGSILDSIRIKSKVALDNTKALNDLNNNVQPVTKSITDNVESSLIPQLTIVNNNINGIKDNSLNIINKNSAWQSASQELDLKNKSLLNQVQKETNTTTDIVGTQTNIKENTANLLDVANNVTDNSKQIQKQGSDLKNHGEDILANISAKEKSIASTYDAANTNYETNKAFSENLNTAFKNAYINSSFNPNFFAQATVPIYMADMIQGGKIDIYQVVFLIVMILMLFALMMAYILKNMKRKQVKGNRYSSDSNITIFGKEIGLIAGISFIGSAGSAVVLNNFTVFNLAQSFQITFILFTFIFALLVLARCLFKINGNIAIVVIAFEIIQYVLITSQGVNFSNGILNSIWHFNILAIMAEYINKFVYLGYISSFILPVACLLFGMLGGLILIYKSKKITKGMQDE